MFSWMKDDPTFLAIIHVIMMKKFKHQISSKVILNTLDFTFCLWV